MHTTKQDTEQLFKEGDVLFRVGKYGIDKVTIIEVKHYPHCVYKDDHGHSYFNRNIRNSCFETQEDAEKEIQRRKNIIEKRKMLKKYELKLNEEFGINNHFIIK